MRSLAALCGLVLLLPSLCMADPFNEFRIPEHSWQSGTASFAMNANRSTHSFAGGHRSDYEGSNGSLVGDFQFQRGFDSDRRSTRWAIWASEGLQLSSSRYTFIGPILPYPEEGAGWLRRPMQQIFLSGSTRTYPGLSQFGVELGLDGSGYWSEDVRRSDLRTGGPLPSNRNENRTDTQTNRYEYSAAASATLGHGVVRLASMVEDVHVLESRLEQSAVLTRPLSTDTRAKLAQLLVISGDLRNVHERPSRFFWREVERLLREDGALADGKLDAYSQLHLLESYRIGPEWRRAIGHFVGLMVQASHVHSIERFDQAGHARVYRADTLSYAVESSYADRTDLESNRVFVGPSVEWHLPVGWRWQWDASGRVLFAARHGERGLRSQSTISGAWLVADRWQARLSALHIRDYLLVGDDGDASPHDEWAAQAVLSLDYFLEDHLKLTAELRETQRLRRVGPGTPFSRGVTRDHADSFYLGLTYRFLGRVSAPGLMETMRAL